MDLLNEHLKDFAMEFIKCRNDLKKAGESLIINPEVLIALKTITEPIKKPFTEVSDSCNLILHSLERLKEKCGNEQELAALQGLITPVPYGGKLQVSLSTGNNFVNLDEVDQELIRKAIKEELRKSETVIINFRKKCRALTQYLIKLEDIYSSLILDLDS